MNFPALAAAAIIVFTAFYHSGMGERRIIAPLMTLERGALDERARRALRFTWHLAALLMLLTAAAIAWPDSPSRLVGLIGAVYLGLGLLSLWLSKGRHPSWYLFGGAGIAALIAAV